ncbi:MAG: porin family protein [Rhodospirillales bacterium]|nr:porin family protein [Rhodospirillales bacterium]MCB9997280.1 porin family protein [Rhodospirillales bacterium]
MKHSFKILALTLVCAVVAATAAHAQSSRLYLAGYMGLNTSGDHDFSEGTMSQEGEIKNKNTFTLAGALGVRLTPQWRLEAEISHRSAEMDRVNFRNATANTFKLGGETQTWLYMMNLYYDIDWTWKNFQPFLTAGLGLASHETQIYDTSGLLPNATDDSLGFAWSLGGGLKYRLNPDTALTTNYRYIGANDLEVDSYDVEYSSHEFRLGIEYDLPTNWLD